MAHSGHWPASREPWAPAGQEALGVSHRQMAGAVQPHMAYASALRGLMLYSMLHLPHRDQRTITRQMSDNKLPPLSAFRTLPLARQGGGVVEYRDG